MENMPIMPLIQNYLLNRIFTVPYLDRLICGESEVCSFKGVSDALNFGDDTYGGLLHCVYEYMDNAYRNEYYFKNSVIKQILLEESDISSTVAYSELPVADSRADLVMINGKGVVYEIKTDLDNFDRLKNQLCDYYKVFPYVNVVVGYSQYETVREMLQGSPTGIYVLYRNGKVRCRKKPKRYYNNLSHEAIFRMLRKNEFEDIILRHAGELPVVDDFHYYRECLRRIGELDINILYKDMLQHLKKRQWSQKRNDIASNAPEELKAYAYFTKKADIDMINRFYERRIG